MTDLVETIRLMRDGEVGSEMTALLTAIEAELPAVDIALDLVQTPERSLATVLQLGALVAALVKELAQVLGQDPSLYLQRFAALQLEKGA